MNVDSIQINLGDGDLFLMNICLALLMFGIALDMKLEDFKRVVSFPKSAVVGLTSQLVLLPIWTLIIIWFFNPIASIALGMILISVCPGGNISNFAVFLGKGNTALSITLTSIVTLMAIFITPLTFPFWASFVPSTEGLMAEISVDAWSMIKIIFQLILVPLIIGMAINAKWGFKITKLKKIMKVLSILIFLGFIIFALAKNVKEIQDYLGIVFLLVLLHNGVAMIIGYYFAALNKLPVPDRKAISLETGIQNGGLGLILIFNFFPNLGGMILVAAWWGIWDMASSLLVASYWSRNS